MADSTPIGQRTVDKLQGRLREEVFHYAADSKKAAGRALGTIIELISYYKLVEWGLTRNTLIERRIPEYANAQITHNVEFSLHRSIKQFEQPLLRTDERLGAIKLGKMFEIEPERRTAELILTQMLPYASIFVPIRQFLTIGLR